MDKTQHPSLICSSCLKDIPFLLFQGQQGKMTVTQKCSCNKDSKEISVEDYLKQLNETTAKTKDAKPITCATHHKTYTSFCKKCNVNLCPECLSSHADHYCIDLTAFDLKTINPETIKENVEEAIKLHKMILDKILEEPNQKIKELTEQLAELVAERDKTTNVYEQYCQTNRTLVDLIHSIHQTLQDSPCYQLINLCSQLPLTKPLIEDYRPSSSSLLKWFTNELMFFIIPETKVYSRQIQRPNLLTHKVVPFNQGKNIIFYSNSDIHLYDFPSNTYKSLKTDSRIKKCRVLSNGQIALVYDNYTIDLYDSAALDTKKTLDGTGDILKEFNGKLLTSSTSDNMNVWNTTTGESVGTIPDSLYKYDVYALNDGRIIYHLLFSDEQITIYFLDLKGCLQENISITGAKLIGAIPLRKTNKLITIEVDENSILKLLNLDTMQYEVTNDKVKVYPQKTMMINDCLVICHKEGTHIYNTATLELIAEFNFELEKDKENKEWKVLNNNYIIMKEYDYLRVISDTWQIVNKLPYKNVLSFIGLDNDFLGIKCNYDDKILIVNYKTAELVRKIDLGTFEAFKLIYLNDYEFGLSNGNCLRLYNA